MSLADLLASRSQDEYERLLPAAQAELSAILGSTGWASDIYCATYTDANYDSLWRNELAAQIRSRLESHGKTEDDYRQWLGGMHLVQVAVYWPPLFEDYRRNMGWRILLLGIPAVSALAVGIASHYQQGQNHARLGRVSNLLFDQAERGLAQAGTGSSLPGRKVNGDDWDHDGLLKEPIASLCGVDVSDVHRGRGLFLSDLRTTTAKKIIASFVSVQKVTDPAGELPGLLRSLCDAGRILAESVYPFDDLRQFEAFRSLAMQDLPAASQQLLLRRKPSTRTVVRVYYGPPGTGKTLTAVKDAVELADPAFDHGGDFQACFQRFNQLHEQVAFVTFHQGLQYEDVVESIRPVLANTSLEAGSPELEASPGDDSDRATVDGEALPPTDGAGASNLEYYLHSGPLMRMIRHASVFPDLEHVLVIDEINRGDISRILGPLISVIEPDKRAGSDFPIGYESQYPRAPELESRIFLPPNVHILGTMNSADRNIALVDYALRRRFDFIELPPQEDLVHPTQDDPSIDTGRLLGALNSRIRHLLDRDHCIGHGYFMRCKTNQDVIEVVARRILPLLREYFYGNESSILLTVGDRPGGSYNIYQIAHAEDQFEDVFGITVDEALAIGHRPPRETMSIVLDPRFWNPNRLIPGPEDESYAIKALQKIYLARPETLTLV